MFKKNDVKAIAKILECDVDTAKKALYTANSIIKKNSVNTYSTARAFKVMLDIINKSKAAKKRKSEYPTFNMKHKAILLYRYEIIQLFRDNENDEKFGYGLIVKHLKYKYNLTVSRSTIKNYIDKYIEYTIEG